MTPCRRCGHSEHEHGRFSPIEEPRPHYPCARACACDNYEADFTWEVPVLRHGTSATIRALLWDGGAAGRDSVSPSWSFDSDERPRRSGA